MFFSKKPYDPEREIGDLTGKVFLITGAYSGIGYEATKQIAAHGATVYLACRTKDRTDAAIAQLEKDMPKLAGTSQLRFLEIDLGDMRSVKRAADEFMKQETRLDVLVHNAGRMLGTYELQDGIELTMAVNHLAVFVLTQALIPILKATAQKPDADVRVVAVSSRMHSLTPASFKFDSLEGWNDFSGYTYNGFLANNKRYGISKYMNILWASRLQKIFDEEGVPITVLTLHPGLVATDAVGRITPTLLRPVIWLRSYTPAVGAYNTLFAATSKVVAQRRDEFKGKYIEPVGKITQPHVKDPYNEVRAKTLWDTTVKISDDMLRA
ncbi:NAD-P-binding protein [Vararia minispora EC-137]|uniref:NAD-P-binding protein n=1 Tax=Vararia minispora EC-137 TaxID=1314806 RepID=A0ACB8QNA9_9AGAM|nr:NAD-P-binding protein [Vararia minispora EC-137]